MRSSRLQPWSKSEGDAQQRWLGAFIRQNAHTLQEFLLLEHWTRASDALITAVQTCTNLRRLEPLMEPPLLASFARCLPKLEQLQIRNETFRRGDSTFVVQLLSAGMLANLI